MTATLLSLAAADVPPKPLTSTQIGALVKSLRELQGWTQETLAELSGLSDRSIRRIEHGDPADRDSLRALARAFQFEDIDLFTKPMAIPTAEQVAEYERKLEAETVVVAVEPLTGRSLRDILERTDALLPVYGCTDDTAESRFAGLVDLVRDYVDVRPELTETFKLDMQREFGVALDVIRSVGHVVIGGVRGVRVRPANGQPVPEESSPLNVLYLKCEPTEKAATSLRVLRQVQFGF